PVSLRLRVWDTLVAHEHNKHTRSGGDFIEFERNGSRHSCQTGKMDASQRGRIVAKGTTDSSGQCRFENLAAGIYFVQARKDNLWTEFAVIHPARGGQDLYLARAGILHLLVKYAASSVFAEGAISGAGVELKSPQSLIPTVRQTNVFGEVDINPVLWGSYQLTVSPPQALFLESKTTEIDVEEPDTFVCIEFEAKRYSISGAVLTVGKKKPVAEFGLGRRCLSDVLEAPRLCKSKEDGSFVFSGIRPGEYEIRPDIPRGTYKGYMPAGWQPALGDPTQATIKVTLEDKDVTGLEYLVVGGVKTRFKGEVTKSDGSPIQDAFVSLDVPEYITESGDSSGEDGRFDLCIFLPPDDREHGADIKAIVYGPRPLQSKEVTERTMDVGGGIVATVRVGQPLGPKYQQTLLQGSCPVNFKVGDTVRDIHVVMKGPDEAPAVVGRIITEDGIWPIPLIITMWYEDDRGPDRYAQIAEDGSFRIDWMHPGPFTLRVDFFGSLMAKVDSTFDVTPNQPVCPKFIRLEMPADQRILHVDVSLSKAGQIAGRVINKESQPIIGARIIVRGTDYSPNKSITEIHTFETDEDGLFWVYGQQVGKEHTVEVVLPGASEPAARIEGVKPPEQNIIFRLDTGE
ncbi:MAG: hypothetical protein ABIH23_30935, partial [bacterium]